MRINEESMGRKKIILMGTLLILCVGIVSAIVALHKTKSRPPARFELNNFTVSPSKIRAGENVLISSDITNIGELPGTYTATFTVDGQVVHSDQVYLLPHENRRISFSKRITKAGLVKIGLDNLASMIEVMRPFPFKGDNLVYQGGGIVVFVGKISGGVIIKVTDVTKDSFSTVEIPTGDLTLITGEKAENRTYKIGECPGFSEEVKRGILIGYESRETKFGTMKLAHYRFENQTEYGQENTDVYVEPTTGIALFAHYESPIAGWWNFELVETNVPYIIAKAKEEVS
jgi:hypothetical protein